jgi:glycosyltransferase involved in cell wall biosynthesis
VKTFSVIKEIRRERRRKLQFRTRSEKIVLAIREFSPDVILSFQISSSGYIKDGVDDIPVVTMLHGHPDFYEMAEREKDILRKSQRVQVLLPQYEDIFKAKFSKNPPEVVCIHNSVPVYKELSDGMGKKILHIGRIAPEKRQHLLVEAFSLLQKEFPDWTLELWGERSDLEYDKIVCDVIRKCGMNPDSVLKGVSSNVENILKSGSIFVFPSSVEGFPLALTEAMSMGLCCVGCCDCLSVSTLVKDGYSGILTQPNGKDLAEAIKKAMTTPSLRINFGRNASSDMKKYSKERVVEEWISLFEELVTRRR